MTNTQNHEWIPDRHARRDCITWLGWREWEWQMSYQLFVISE